VMLSACGGTETEETQEQTQQEETQDESTNEGDSTESQAISIEATNFAFNQTEYTAKAGEPVNISFKSVEGMHGIAISGADVTLNDGESKSVTLEAGEYTIVCSIPCGSGHSEMVAKLIVT
jgi:cytochrome c oxidase subunit 2